MGVVRLAALLHDADDRKLFGDNGYANARRFMESEGIPAETQDEVIRIISQISFRGTDSVVPDTLEGRIVQDADRMDAKDSPGRGQDGRHRGDRHRQGVRLRGQPRTRHARSGRGAQDGDGCGAVPCQQGPGMDAEQYHANRGTTVNHFYEKLLLLKDSMNTGAAKRMAASRHEYMVGFLDEFMAEWDGSR